MLLEIASVLGGLVALFLIAPLFLPSHFSMSRSIEINAPISKVFSKLASLNEYAKWGFPDGDKTHQASVTGHGINSFLIWKGDRTGEGKMTITQIEPEKRIEIKMIVQKPMVSESVLHLTTHSRPGSKTEMKWTVEQDLSYLKRYFSLMMNAMMGNHVEACLQKFKSLVETN